MLRLGLMVLALAGLAACRQADPADAVRADAQAYFACDQIDVRYSGQYDAPRGDVRIELYEAYATCGGAATYRCEIFDDGSSVAVDCCRYGDQGCEDA